MDVVEGKRILELKHLHVRQDSVQKLRNSHPVSKVSVLVMAVSTVV
jgi:hypothetical protein